MRACSLIQVTGLQGNDELGGGYGGVGGTVALSVRLSQWACEDPDSNMMYSDLFIDQAFT